MLRPDGLTCTANNCIHVIFGCYVTWFLTCYFNSSNMLFQFNCQLSTVNCQLPTANCQLSPVNCQLSTVNCQLSKIYCQRSTVNCPLPTVSFHSTVNCQLPTANCQLSTANCQLSTVNCQLHHTNIKTCFLGNHVWNACLKHETKTCFVKIRKQVSSNFKNMFEMYVLNKN